MTVKRRDEHVLDEGASLVEQMAEDAQAGKTPREYPPGTPEFRPLLAIRPRSRRAELKRLYAQVAEESAKVKKAQMAAAKLKPGSEERYAAELRMWAQMDELYEAAEKVLQIAAVDSAAFDTWAIEVDDNDLMTAFNVYQEMTQPGEAPSSTS